MNKNFVKNNNLVGNLYYPEKQIDKLPAIILISGSDGGMPGANAIPESFIENLVSNNFVVLALAYFGVDRLPKYLENIDLEYFENAFCWLNSQPQVKTDSIGIIGQSRGGELALMLGTLFPDNFKAIISYVLCSMVCGGFPHPNRPAWIYRGEAISPYLGGVSNTDINLTELNDLINTTKEGIITPHKNTQEDPIILAELFKVRNKQINHELTEIPVETIKCPLLLFSGGQDDLWPCEYYCQMVINRLNIHNSSIFRKHINYKDAGHGIFASRDGGIYHPFGEFWCKLGGTLEGNEIAKKESNIELLNFLTANLT